VSFEVFIFHDNSYDMLFPFRTLDAAKQFGEKVRSGFGKWVSAGPDKWLRGEYQQIVRRTLE